MTDILLIVSEWISKNLAGYVGPAVSLLGAGVSWYWAKRRMELDAGKELGALRADTIELLDQALRLDNPTWRRSDLNLFHQAHQRWLRLKEERAPLMSRRTFSRIQQVQSVLRQVKEDVLGIPLGGLAAQEYLEVPSEFDANDISDKTRESLQRLFDELSRDPRFLSK